MYENPLTVIKANGEQMLAVLLRTAVKKQSNGRLTVVGYFREIQTRKLYLREDKDVLPENLRKTIDRWFDEGASALPF